jgi:hypothetical protein
MQVYPNPAQSEIMIKFDQYSKVQEVKIINMIGNEVRSGGNELLNTSLNVSDYASGVYMVRINAGNHAITGKFIKK